MKNKFRASSDAKRKKSPARRNSAKQRPKGNAPSRGRDKADDSSGANRAPLQGSKLILPDVEPWPEPVDGAEVLSQVSDTIRIYVALPDGAADATALWCPHTHVFTSFEISPRLNICSPEKGCGKTTLRDVIGTLVARPLPTENLTTAVLFRVVQAQRPTLLADEYDAWLRDKEELRGIINAGHKRGGGIYRCVGDHHDVRKFECFAPVVLCGIGSLPPTIRDRSIVVRLMRAKPGEISKRFDSRRTEAERDLCRKLARWCQDNRDALAKSEPALPARATNRLADNWRPLFAIAEVAGGDWPQRVRAAFEKLNGMEDEEAHGVAISLIADTRLVFTEEKTDRLPSESLCEKLANIEDRPWAKFGRSKERITAHELARLLQPFGIHTRNTKCDEGRVRKAYHLEDFADAFARYLPTEGV